MSPVQFFFIFMLFSGKNGQIIGWHPHLGDWCLSVWEILDPPLFFFSNKGQTKNTNFINEED